MNYRARIILFFSIGILIIILFFIFNLNFPFILFFPLICCWPFSSRNRGESEFESIEQTEEGEIPENHEYKKKESFTELDYLTCLSCGNEIKELNLRFCPYCGVKLR